MNFNALFLAQEVASGVHSDFLHHIDRDALSAALIVAVAGTVAFAIVFTICVTVTIQRRFAIRESNKLIRELVQRGFSAEEIEDITYGNANIGKKVGKMFRHARNAFRCDTERNGNAVPPVKSA